ncbi:MAG: glycosyltransferase family 9 protein [bacterium]
MGIFKSLEISLRRFLIRALSLFVRRNNSLPPTIDFNTCKFLFVRQDRIGDVLISTPLYRSLKNHYPNATVDFFLSSNNHFVLDNDPLIRKRWIYRKSFSHALSLLRAIRKEQYDFVIDLMDNPSTTSTVFCALANGKWNIGLSKENHYVYDITIPLLSRRDVHIIDRIAQLLTVFKIDPSGERFDLSYKTSQQSDSFAEEFLQSHKIIGRSLIAVNISPTDGVRYWGRENYQRLFLMLQREFQYHPILLLCQPSDRKEAEEIIAQCPGITLSPITPTFDQFAALVKHSAILITPDTSVVHLAAAYKIPSVVLYVQSNKELRIWEPYGVDCEALVTEIDDLRTIPVEKVEQAFRSLYKRTLYHGQ